MSNLSDQLDFITKDTDSTSVKGVDSTPNRWSFIQQELESARQSWDELEKSEPGLSPEEEQLLQIKTIIGQLKTKLDQF